VARFKTFILFSALASATLHSNSIDHRQMLASADLSVLYNFLPSVNRLLNCYKTTPTTTILRSFFWDHPGESVPEENFWTLWCKGRLTEADTPTIRLGTTPFGLTSAHLHHPIFLQARCPSCRPTNSVKALKATSALGLGRRR